MLCRAALVSICVLTFPFHALGQASLLWRTNYHAPTNIVEEARFCRVDGNGNVYVVGAALRPVSSSGYSILALKLSPEGTLLWSRLFVGPEKWDEPADAVVDSAGDLLITGNSANGPNGTDIVVLKISSSGEFAWTNWVRLTNAPNLPGAPAYPYHDASTGIAVDSTRNVYVGGTGRNTETDVLLTKFSPDGARLWTARYDYEPGSMDSLLGMDVDAATGVTYASVKAVNPTNSVGRHLFLKFSAVGAVEWVRDSGETNLVWELSASRVLISQDAGIYFTLRSQGRPALWKYDSSGTLVWLSMYRGPSGPMPHDAAVDLFGNVTLASSNLVVHFDRTGMQQWAARLRNGANPVLAIDATQTPFAHARDGDPESQGFIVTRFASDGSRPWSVFTPHLNTVALANDVVATDGVIITADTAYGESDSWNVWVAKYATNVLPGPRIISLSKGLIATAGSSVTLQVGATGAGSLRYQWILNGQEISGATNAALTFALTTNLTGSYWVEIADANGITSSPEIPVGEAGLANQETIVGGTVLFSAIVQGILPRSVRWRFGGSYLTGETNLLLRLTNVSASASGIYTAEIDDGFGQTNLISAALSVSDQVEIAWLHVLGPVTNVSSTLRLAAVAQDNIGHVVLLNARRDEYELLVFATNGTLTNRAFYLDYGSPAASLVADGNGNLFVVNNDPNQFGHSRVTKFLPLANSVAWSRAVSPARYNWSAGLLLDTNDTVLLLQSVSGGALAPFTGFMLSRVSSNATTRLASRTVSTFEPPYYQTATYIGLRGMTRGGGQVSIFWNWSRAGGETNYVTRVLDGGTTNFDQQLPEGIEIGQGALASDEQGNVDFTGANVSSTGHAIVKLSPAATVVWRTLFFGVGSQNLQGDHTAALDSAGDLVVLTVPGTLKVAPDGNVLWVNRVAARRMVLSPARDAYLLSEESVPDGTTNIVVSKVNSAGALLWKAPFRVPTNAPVRVTGIAVADHGVYVCGSVGDYSVFLARLSERPESQAPMLGVMPDARSINTGATVIIEAPVSSGSAVQFQWYLDGMAIAGATNQNLALTNFRAQDAGNYSVTARNRYGATTSPEIWLLPPLLLSNVTRDVLANTRSFTFDADARYGYEVQTATVLGTWKPHAVFVYSNGPVTFADPDTNAGPAFYRVRVSR
jgi:hypothetical protein